MSRPVKLTMKEIGSLAGVYRTTVDRFLKNKGKISTSASARIRKVLAGVDYVPNRYASALAKSKEFKLYVILPYHYEDSYYGKVEEGIRTEFHSINFQGKSLDFHYYEMYSRDSFMRNINEAIVSKPLCVIIGSTLDSETTSKACSLLENNIISYSLLDSFVDNNFITFHGQDGEAIGRFMAEMLSKIKLSNTIYICKENNTNIPIQQRMREKGFMDYFFAKQKYVLSNNIHFIDFKDITEKWLCTIPDNSTFISFNSKISAIYDKIIGFSKETKGFHYCGYDTSSRNIELIKNNEIDFIICQRPVQQGKDVVRSLFNFCILNIKPKKIQMYPIDFLIRENIAFHTS